MRYGRAIRRTGMAGRHGVARVAAALAALTCAWLTAAAAWAGPGPEGLKLLSDEYPRAFYFRRAEALAAREGLSYEDWESTFLLLDGIMGKCLDEELPGRSRRNIDFFTRYKLAHPDKAVLLHFNGNARDPRFETAPYFAGHWLYYNGCALTADLPADAAATVVHVADPSLFRVGIGRFDDDNDDLAICALDETGRPDWARAEQLALVAVDPAAKTLTVRRGAFGTAPEAFEAGHAHVAAHVTEGPWGQNSSLLWAYNYASACPRDAAGRTCADRLTADLARWFGPDGPLAAFDGLEFDVLQFGPFASGPRGRDADADGHADGGVVDGVNVYGVGVQQFLAQVREALGPGRLVLADGHSPRHQRGIAYLNGIESEGWPDLSDGWVEDWAGGLNRHRFWQANGYAPALSYINHKHMEAGEPAPLPAGITRLVLAAACFTDSAFTYSLAPPNDGALFGVWDELCMGAAQQPRWLGRPEGDAIRLAYDTADLLAGAGAAPEAAFAARCEAQGGRVSVDAGRRALCITGAPAGAAPGAGCVRVRLPDIDAPAGDILVRCTLTATPRAAYGPGVPRLIWVGWQ
ncbi:MAG: hypothetical protein JXR94_16350, partial [Candidatus Hydrogenedentes bacterium]|nr:hypothetical protein [Candidatus Hydrogenedentota bacterium]